MTNERVLRKAGTTRQLMDADMRRKKYYGHIVRRDDLLADYHY